MKLTAFQSDKGDCLTLESSDGKNRMLIDGGMKRAYSEHVAPVIGALRKAKKKLDIVYISHIDEDHIAGVLQLLDDEAAWRVHEHHVKNGNRDHPVPETPRPPQIEQMFHNAFHDQVGKNSGDIESMLAATATLLSATEHPALQEIIEERQNLVTSIPQAMKVSHRIKQGQLNISLNPQSGGKLMMADQGEMPTKLGSIQLNVIGPFADDLMKLRKEWNVWLKANAEKVKKIRAQAKTDESKMTTSEVDRLLSPLLSASEQFGAMELALAKQLGNRKKSDHSKLGVTHVSCSRKRTEYFADR